MLRLSSDKRILIQIDSSDIDKNGYFKVPDGVELIESYVVSHCTTSLRKIDINQATKISEYAFYFANNLETFIGAPTAVETSAFRNCKELTSFDFSQIKELETCCFANSGLVEADISGLDTIPGATFINCEALTTVVGAPKYIYGKSFANCKSLTSLDFSQLKGIGPDAFSGSKLDCCVHSLGKKVVISYRDYYGVFARYSSKNMAYKISGIIDEEKNAYVDEQGIPFILTEEENEKVSFNNDKEKFIKIWHTL